MSTSKSNNSKLPLGITKRSTSSGEVRYDYRFRDLHGKQRKRTFKRLEDAKKFQRTTEADMVRGTWIDDAHGKVLFSVWWERYWATTVNLRPSSRARDESYARNHILPHFGDSPLSAIKHADVTAWIASLTDKGLAPATVQKAQQILSKCLGSAVDSDMIPSNPCDRVKLPRVERQEMLFLTPQQVGELADTVDERYRALILVGAYCGLRFGELAALEVSRVDLLRRTIDVALTVSEVKGTHHVGPPKTRAGRRKVPVPSLVAEELQHHLNSHAQSDLVFPAPVGGYLRGSLFRRRVWHPACVAAGLGRWVDIDEGQRYRKYEGPRIHDLRHTAVAFWIAAGASPKDIATRAGHSSVVTVLDRYGHLLPGHDEPVNDALDAMFRASKSAQQATVHQF